MATRVANSNGTLYGSGSTPLQSATRTVRRRVKYSWIFPSVHNFFGFFTWGACTAIYFLLIADMVGFYITRTVYFAWLMTGLFGFSVLQLLAVFGHSLRVGRLAEGDRPFSYLISVYAISMSILTAITTAHWWFSVRRWTDPAWAKFENRHREDQASLPWDTQSAEVQGAWQSMVSSGQILFYLCTVLFFGQWIAPVETRVRADTHEKLNV